MKPQVKTQKLLKLISNLKSSLREDMDIGFFIHAENSILTISYAVCVRRDKPSNVIQRFKDDLNKFVRICKNSKIPAIEEAEFVEFNEKFKEYGDEAYTGYSSEYTEYEICIYKTFKYKLGKNQEKFFSQYVSE